VDRRLPQQEFNAHEGWVTGEVFTPDEEHALSCGYNKAVRFWALMD
jgi:WD40 repeat protein